MSGEKPGQNPAGKQDKNPGAFGKWSIPELEQSFELDGGDGLFGDDSENAGRFRMIQKPRAGNPLKQNVRNVYAEACRR